MQQYMRAIVFQCLALQAFPDIGWEVASLGQPRGECLDGLLVADAATLKNHSAEPAQARSRLAGTSLVILKFYAPACRASQFRADAFRYIASRTFSAHDETITVQLHISVFNRVPGNAQ